MKNKGEFLYFCFFLTAILTALLLNGCSWFDDTTGGDSNSSSNNDSNNGSGSDNSVTVTVSPASVTLAKGGTQEFSATVTNSYSQSVTWSVEGRSSTLTTISKEGSLSVGWDESAGTLTVRATWSSYSDSASGTATVTIVAGLEIPSNLKITKPGKTGVLLSWNAVNNAASYKVYRSINNKDYSHLGNATSASYSDTDVSPGSSYYYAVSAGMNGPETGKSSVVFGFAEEYFALPVFADRRLVPITAGQKHYYRFPVTSGESYTITWENGSSQNTDYYGIRCSAWQNDGTEIFNNAANGYTSPQVFTAIATGYVTVEVRNTTNSNRYNYIAYCFRKSNESDVGVAAMPPAPVTGIKVTDPSASSITLAWDSVPDAASYNIYRSPTRDATPGFLDSNDSPNFTDINVAPNTSYYYTVAPANSDGKEGAWVERTFAYTVSHYPLPNYSSSQLMNLSAGSKHYYRLAVTAGQGYTITWENGNSQNTDYYGIRCSAWQNDGTEIFNNAANGYTSPQVFTATVTGYVTIEVRNTTSSNSYDYKIYR